MQSQDGRKVRPLKIFYISDIHLEFGAWKLPKVIDADVVVLAGDIGVGTQGLLWACKVFTSIPVVYVPGNHEYYHQNMETLREELKYIASHHSNIHLLDDGAVTVADVRFVGGTLWTDFNLFHSRPLSMLDAQRAMADFEYIDKDRSGSLVPEDTYVMHQKTKRLIEEELKVSKACKTVVVTHHCPSEMSVSPKYKTDRVSPAFASDLNDLILALEPTLWVHGHTHAQFDYEIGNTRVICNPRGYHRKGRKYVPGKVVEI